MRKRSFLVLFLLIVLGSTGAVGQSTIDWEKWMPLETTRGEIEAVLGKPHTRFDTFGSYDTQIGRFSVWYSDGRCLKDREGLQYRVQKGLMTSFWFQPKSRKPITDYVRDHKKLIHSSDSHNRTTYYHAPDGMRAYSVFWERNGVEIVDKIMVRPTDEKKNLRCESSDKGSARSLQNEGATL
jgi:hypothetical protein